MLRALTDDDINRISEHMERVSLASDEQRRVEGYYELDEIAEYKDGYAAILPELKAAVAVGDITTLGPLLQQFLDVYRYENQLSNRDFRRLAIAYGQMAIRTNEKLLRRYEGELVPTPSAIQQEQHLLSLIITDYIKDYTAKNQPAMLKKIEAVLPMFFESTGDKNICDLRQSDVNNFFQLVHKLPPRWKDVARQRKLPLAQVADLGLGGIAQGTFDDTYKAVIRRFLTWSRTNWQDKGFPTTLTTDLIDYQGSRAGGQGRQRAFKDAELTRLLTGPEMVEFANDPSEHHKFWLPHVGLFTGARVTELCQINPQVDIHQDKNAGVWYLDITEDTASDDDVVKTVKTDSSKRRVPIHSQLIATGFLDYVKYQKKRGRKLLFSPFKPSQGRASAEAQKWFRKFLEEVGLRDETPYAKLTGMHAFRSTFLSRAFNLGVANAELITGHAQDESSENAASQKKKSKIVRDYQGELEVAVKSEILERIVWSDLKLITPKKSLS